MQCTSVAQHITTAIAQDHHKTHYDCYSTGPSQNTTHCYYTAYTVTTLRLLQVLTNNFENKWHIPKTAASSRPSYIIIICKTKHERTQTLLVSRIRKQGKTRGYETSKYRYNEGDKYTCRQSSAYLTGSGYAPWRPGSRTATAARPAGPPSNGFDGPHPPGVRPRPGPPPAFLHCKNERNRRKHSVIELFCWGRELGALHTYHLSQYIIRKRRRLTHRLRC